MNYNFYPSAPSLATREMLFIGFENSFDENIRNFPYQNKTYYFEIINREENAFRWLESRVNDLTTYQMPFALFCSLKWLVSKGFEFARQIREHADLRFVPFVALAEYGETFDRKMLLESGIDDCYTMPVQWNCLEARLDFLNQYKWKMSEISGQLSPESYQYRIPVEKRIFDLAGATLAILFSSVIWLPVAVSIALETNGPLFCHSKRMGANYRFFYILKFRSTTRVGGLIKKYGIDELPQLINVLRGDMSLVGKRPLPIYEAEMLAHDEWNTRALEPAGMTGLWRASQHQEPASNLEVNDEPEHTGTGRYTIWADLAIILKTLRAYVQKENF